MNYDVSYLVSSDFLCQLKSQSKRHHQKNFRKKKFWWKLDLVPFFAFFEENHKRIHFSDPGLPFPLKNAFKTRTRCGILEYWKWKVERNFLTSFWNLEVWILFFCLQMISFFTLWVSQNITIKILGVVTKLSNKKLKKWRRFEFHEYWIPIF